jgi:zinc/manganese transport system substrate-binding protein
MTKRLVAFVVGSLAALASRAGQATLNVVATVPDLAALAQEVGGKNTSVRTIALATQDPHFVDAKPSLVLDLNKADLLLSIGLQLESGWLPVLITNSRNAAIAPGGPGYLDCARFVRLLDVPRQPVDRSMGTRTICTTRARAQRSPRVSPRRWVSSIRRTARPTRPT